MGPKNKRTLTDRIAEVTRKKAIAAMINRGIPAAMIMEATTIDARDRITRL